MLTFAKSLTNRSFAFLWFGQAISRIGDVMYQVCLAWWILEKTGSAKVMGFALSLTYIPMLLFLLLGGALVDRFSRKHLMVVSDVGRGVLMLIVAILDYTNYLQVWHIYGVSIIFGLISAFFQPAFSAILPDILPNEALPSANSLNSLSTQIANTVAPLVAGIALKQLGTGFIYGLNGVSFLIAAICILQIAHSGVPTKAENEPVTSMWQDIRSGLSFVLSSTWLWMTIAIFAVINITSGGLVRTIMPTLVKQHFNDDPIILGLFLTMSGIGAVLGAIWLGSYSKLRLRGILAYAASLGFGAMVAFISFSLPVWMICVAMVLYGIGYMAFSLVWSNTLQELVPIHLLGRVYSVDMFGSFLLLPLGLSMAGWLADLYTPSLIFLCGGLITMLLASIGLAHPAIRKID